MSHRAPKVAAGWHTEPVASLHGPDQRRVIDLRSDTVTQPSAAMWDAMRAAPLGDDVLGDDPTVQALEDEVAALFGAEDAVFASSGTQSNLMGLLAHCGRGDEYIVGQWAHTYRFEGGGAAVLGSVQPQPVPNQPDGTLAIDDIRINIKPPDDPHFAQTRLITLENTWNGKILPLAYQTEVADLARSYGLGMHLDGARLFHAVVSHGHPVAAWVEPYDTVSICLSKGLGAPAGAVLAGSHALISRARRIRKLLGGGMRQAGVLAAAGRYALTHHLVDLAHDHRRTRELAEGLASIDGIVVDPASVQTNMVFIETADPVGLVAYARAHDVLLLARSGAAIRLVLHRDVDDSDVSVVLELMQSWAQHGRTSAL